MMQISNVEWKLLRKKLKANFHYREIQPVSEDKPLNCVLSTFRKLSEKL